MARLARGRRERQWGEEAQVPPPAEVTRAHRLHITRVPIARADRVLADLLGAFVLRATVDEGAVVVEPVGQASGPCGPGEIAPVQGVTVGGVAGVRGLRVESDGAALRQNPRTLRPSLHLHVWSRAGGGPARIVLPGDAGSPAALAHLRADVDLDLHVQPAGGVRIRPLAAVRRALGPAGDPLGARMRGKLGAVLEALMLRCDQALRARPGASGLSELAELALGRMLGGGHEIVGLAARGGRLVIHHLDHLDPAGGPASARGAAVGRSAGGDGWGGPAPARGPGHGQARQVHDPEPGGAPGPQRP